MNPEVEDRAAELRRQRVPFVHARVVRAERPTSAKPGDEAVVLPDGGRALVVGHSPTNEAAVLGLAAEVVGPLGKGDGVLIIEDRGRFHVRAIQRGPHD